MSRRPAPPLPTGRATNRLTCRQPIHQAPALRPVGIARQKIPPAPRAAHNKPRPLAGRRLPDRSDPPCFGRAARPRTAAELWITFDRAVLHPENAPFLPFREVKSALALAPEGVSTQNVKMGMTKCAPFLTFFDPILTPFDRFLTRK